MPLCRYRGGDVPGHGTPPQDLSVSLGGVLKAVFNCGRTQRPSDLTTWIVTGAQILFCKSNKKFGQPIIPVDLSLHVHFVVFSILVVLSIPASYLLARMDETLASSTKSVWFSAIMMMLVLITTCIATQPRVNKSKEDHFTFRVSHFLQWKKNDIQNFFFFFFWFLLEHVRFSVSDTSSSISTIFKYPCKHEPHDDDECGNLDSIQCLDADRFVAHFKCVSLLKV